MTRPRFVQAAIIASIFSTTPTILFAADEKSSESQPAPRDTTHYNIADGKPAIEGYDPVAYFPEGGSKPTKGLKTITHTHQGITYWFASTANRDRFIKDPARYEPAYGGWCATAISDGGKKVEIDPKNFKVTDGRLFLFYKSFFADALKDWKKDEPRNTTEADAQWKKISGESPRKPGN